MSFRARDDAVSPGSGDDAGEMELDALEFAALANATSPREETASSDAFPRPLRRPLRRSGSTATTGDAGEGSGDRQATRLLEALEALSSESGGPMPPSLRSLLGQLQGDETAMAGLYPFMQLLESHGSHPRFHRMLQALDADAPPHVQLSGLSDLCESLSMSSEESLVVSGFSVDKFLPPLLQLVQTPSTMEVLLLAARALASMLDLFPTVAIPKAMADKSVSLVDSICAKLLEIEYMDVAELFFQILEKIVCSAHHASETVAASYRRAVIEANGFVALLQFVDFFPIEIQRTAARVVAGLCLHMNEDFGGELQIALPLISGLLRSSDADMVTHGCRSFQALSASAPFRASPNFAALVASDEICESLVQLMESFASHGEEEASVQISVAASVSTVQFLSAVLAAPHHSMDEQVARLRHARLPLAVAKLVALPTIVDDVALLRETLQLVIGILPPTDSMHEDEEDGLGREVATTVRTFMRAILPCVVHIFEVSSRHEVRYDCLGVILRVCLLQQHFHDPTDDDIAELAHLASFLARVLRPEGGTNQKTEGRRACMALQIVQACLHCDDSSLSAHAQSLFERHGVSAVIRRYAKADDADEGEGVGALSRLLVAEYLGENLSSEPSMEKLRSIVRLLDGSFDEEEDNHRRDALADGLGELLALCRARQEVSTSAGAWLTAHELASSGLARSLHRVLQDADARRVFGKTFLGGDRAETSFLDGLIASVQDAISVEKDAFRVDMYAGMGSTMPISTGSVTSDMDQLVQHIKVRVKIEEGDGTNTTVQTEVKRNKRSVHDTVVLVEPLARIDTIEEFIAERLFGSRSPFDALDDGDEEEALTRRHHRRAARRRDNEAEEKHADADGNEEDEQEMEEAEEDPEEDEDDHDHEHDDDHDHDDEDESSDLRSDRPQKQKRLQVLYGGTVLRSESSVLEAILKSSTSTTSDSSTNGSSGGNPSSEMAKVWTGAPHEFVFRVMGKENGKPLVAAQVEEGKGSKEEMSTSQLPSKTQLEWWDDVWDLLGILKQLHDLLPQSKTQQLVNAYISLQITRALTQPVRVMTHSLPSWSFRIVEEFPFVLEYETRYDFLFATTSGAPRAISYLCRTLWKKAALAEEPQGQGGSSATSTTGGRESRVARRTGGRDRGNGSSSTATAALTNLSRMAKLPRLKVRVARSRLLQSAMKLFSMYGGKKAIIEIEFLGEVGTGLGPTTEFYTLVCHELQAAHLKLWRNDKDVTVEDDEAVGETGGNSSSDVVKQNKKKAVSGDAKKPGLPVRGYHRVAVYHCTSCKHLEIPRCAIHDQLLTHEKIDSDEEDSSCSIPQCAKCLDTRDWHSAYAACKGCCSKNETLTVSDALTTAAAASEETPSSANKPCTLKWWILSDEETTYLRKVFPRDVESIQHPVLQCAHCDTVNFPGTDAGIVVLDASGERMVSRAGRRMYERDYRAVTKHVSPLCEGTPLKQVGVVLTRDAVETLVDCVKKSPELLDSEVESLCYMSEVAMAGEVEVVDAPFGLFPKPYKASMSTKKHKEKDQNVLSWFNFMGRFVAQAILDERLVNLPLSRAFLRALRGEDLVAKDHSEVARSLAFVREIDPAIAQSLTYLSTLAEETTADESSERNASLVESMGLAFTLVGDGTTELCENGKRTDVTLANVREYVRLNVNFLVHDTIQPYVAAFHDGFQTITGCHDARIFLQSFSLAELEFLLADKWLSGDSMWDREGKELRDHMVCDHGYTPHSRAIRDLVAILCELPLDDQRLFVKFVTGANRLPLGGLAKLEPKLTVVRKLAMGVDDSTTGSGADAVLPSASTCTNYLKLPEYSTRETMEKRLAYCIREGQGSFHLS